MNSTPRAAAHAIRALDTDRRERVRARRESGFEPKTRVGPARMSEIGALLKRAGWSLRDVVDRKLPLTRLPSDLKPLVRSGRLEPLKALLLNQIRDKDVRGETLRATLEGRYSTRALAEAVRGKRRTKPRTDPQLETELRWIELEISRQLGLKATLSPTSLTLEYHDTERLSDLLETLGVQL